MGLTIPAGLLVNVMARPKEEVLVALKATCRAHLLEEVGEDSYQFTHDVIWEVTASSSIANVAPSIDRTV